MRHLRKDYDAIQPFPTKRPHWVKVDGQTVEVYDDHLGQHMDPVIPDDEPVFLLRAKDSSAPHLVRLWAIINEEENGADPALCARVAEWAGEMQAYAEEHYGGGKTPDTPPEFLRG